MSLYILTLINPRNKNKDWWKSGGEAIWTQFKNQKTITEISFNMLHNTSITCRMTPYLLIHGTDLDVFIKEASSITGWKNNLIAYYRADKYTLYKVIALKYKEVLEFAGRSKREINKRKNKINKILNKKDYKKAIDITTSILGGDHSFVVFLKDIIPELNRTNNIYNSAKWYYVRGQYFISLISLFMLFSILLVVYHFYC